MLLIAACADDSNDTASDSSPTASLTDSPDGGSDDSPAAIESPDSPADEPTEAESDQSAEFGFSLDAAQEDPPGETEDPGNGSAFAIPVFLGREIIFTADVIVESADVGRATSDVIDTVLTNGGAIWGQETRTDPTPQTVLTIRVPPGEPFARVLEAVAGLEGTNLVSQSLSTDDVTEVVVDLDARIVASESSVARVQTLLDAATDLNTVFTLEEELATRQAQLERLRGQRKTIGDQIALATINLTIVELDPDRLAPGMDVVAWLGTDLDDACPGVSDLSIGADDTAVLCVNIHNTGEDTLTELDIESSTFRLRVDEFTVNPEGDGSLDSLAPGEELLVYADLDAEDGFISRVDASGGLEIAVAVHATPATTPDVELRADDTVFISADVEDSLPGFGDSFSSGWNAMATVVGILMIIVGTLLPFSVFIALGIWIGRWWLRRSRERAAARAAYVQAYVASTAPVPPPPPAD